MVKSVARPAQCKALVWFVLSAKLQYSSWKNGHGMMTRMEMSGYDYMECKQHKHNSDTVTHCTRSNTYSKDSLEAMEDSRGLSGNCQFNTIERVWRCFSVIKEEGDEENRLMSERVEKRRYQPRGLFLY